MKRTLPTGLEESVRGELARLGGDVHTDGDLVELVRAWPLCVGDAIAVNAWPARIARDGTLIVHTSSSAWAFELTQLEGEIRARLGQLAPARAKFVPGPLPEAAADGVSEKRARVDIQPEADRRARALAADIVDPELRELVARAAAISLSGAGQAPEATGPSGRLTGR